MTIRAVLLIAFTLRLLLPLTAFAVTGDNKVFHEPDTLSYTEAARGLATKGRFVEDGAPEVERTPGYPLLLVPGTLLGNIDLVAIALQIALACFTVYLVYKVGLLLFGNARTALFCALLYAVEPISVLYTAKVLTETLFAAVVVLFLYLVLRYVKAGATGYLYASAFALAAAAYVRPIVSTFPIIMAAILFVWALVSLRRKGQLLAVGVFLLASLGLTGMWQIRNANVAHYDGFSAIADVNWYFYQGASVLADKQGLPYTQVQEQLGYYSQEKYLQIHPEQRGWEQGKRYTWMGKEGRRIVFSDLPIYAKIHLEGMLRTLVSPGGASYLSMLKIAPADDTSGGSGLEDRLRYLLGSAPLALAFAGSALALAVYLGLALYGLLSKRLLRNALAIPVVALGLYLLIFSGGPQSDSRFRHPLMPIICLFAGYGLSKLIGRRRTTDDTRQMAVNTQPNNS